MNELTDREKVEITTIIIKDGIASNIFCVAGISNRCCYGK